ncbi:MAG TPA: diadenylate cyclase CdaA [Erysipelotrichaceae bacterium]|nr:diadenylate cyclase CdaA [Erysipelotrichaceae bacterium]
MLELITLPKLLQFGQVLLDILIMAVIIHYSLRIIRNNARTVQIFKGIIFVLIANFISKILGFETVQIFTATFMTWGILAIIIIFQPEIRSVLERLGKSSVFSTASSLSQSERSKLINEIVESVSQLASEKTGALITIEQDISLADYIKTGTTLNSQVSKEILSSIFVVGTPLHDGAVIIQGNRLAAASVFFPPTDEWLPSKYGARHRAAIGISEVSDSVTIIVSEETGLVSIAQEGKMSLISVKELSQYLHKVLFGEEEVIEVAKPEVDKSEEKISQIEREIRQQQKEELEAKRIIQQFSKSYTDDEEGDF